MNEQDKKNLEIIKENVKKRCPALMFASSLGGRPSVEEALFLSAIVEDETKKLGLPEFWYVKITLLQIDEQESKINPYKCGKCGRRWNTSDKRNACCENKL